MTGFTTTEKAKMKQYSVASIIKHIDNFTIRFDHPAQRQSNQWSALMKGNLISDMLQGNPIPPLVFAEQIIDGISVVWDLDGKQRCSNVYNYANNTFKIGNKIRRPFIQYQTKMRDDNGNVIKTENGVPKFEVKTCDIRNKKFSQLPDELKDRFMDYTLDVTQYLNCSSDDILYHIERYNEGKQMNQSQKGIIRLGSEFTETVKEIAESEFFAEKGKYSANSFKNGAISRLVVETVMLIKYPGKWEKNGERLCAYIKDNADMQDFEDFKNILDRLYPIIDNNTAEVFTIKNSHIWFALFDRFTKINENDRVFAEFIKEFLNNLHAKELDGTSFDRLENEYRATKDKNVILMKLDFLTQLMCDYIKTLTLNTGV